MSSLKPKEGGGFAAPPPPPRVEQGGILLKAGLIVCVMAIAVIGYSSYSGRQDLEQKIADLQKQQKDELTKLDAQAAAMKSDIETVGKKAGVTASELDASRKFAEKLRQDQEQEKQQLTSELAKKASASDVSAVRQEATTKLSEVQQDANTKIGSVSGEVKTVATNLEATRQDLAASKRDLIDVKTTLSQQIAKNSSELADLRKKGERDFFEFDIHKEKKNAMQRVADIQMAVEKTDPKKGRYDVLIQVDDNKLEKKDQAPNTPIQFLVGRDKLRYEVVVNTIDKDRIRGYLSTPKDKVLSAERPTFRPPGQ